MTNVFLKMIYTTEFKPVTLALASEDGNEFYAIFTDFGKSNIFIKNVLFKYSMPETADVCGTREEVKKALKLFFCKIPDIKIWVDLGAREWVIFMDMFESSILPPNVSYAYGDIGTLLYVKGFVLYNAKEQISGIRDSYYTKMSARQGLETLKKLL